MNKKLAQSPLVINPLHAYKLPCACFKTIYISLLFILSHMRFKRRKSWKIFFSSFFAGWWWRRDVGKIRSNFSIWGAAYHFHILPASISKASIFPGLWLQIKTKCFWTWASIGCVKYSCLIKEPSIYYIIKNLAFFISHPPNFLSNNINEQ